MTTTEPSPPTSDGEIHAQGISTLIQKRKITEVVHFTTNRGLLGILVQRLCKARALLAKDEYLESIYHENTKWRREDPKYWSYVNLSISEPNHRFLRISSEDWWANEDLFWAVLSFDPVIMTHPGVLFAPGNMGYEGITPVEGLPGAEALFADRVPKGFKKTMPRWDRAPHLPTNPQADELVIRTEEGREGRFTVTRGGDLSSRELMIAGYGSSPFDDNAEPDPM